MKTDNEIIAEFMGAEFVRKQDLFDSNRYNETYIFKGHPGNWRVEKETKSHLTAPMLAYHTDCNWLMPVVEKIESNDRTLVVIYSDATKIWVDDFEGIELFATTQTGNKDNKIDHVRRACLEYINWHNSQPK